MSDQNDMRSIINRIDESPLAIVGGIAGRSLAKSAINKIGKDIDEASASVENMKGKSLAALQDIAHAKDFNTSPESQQAARDELEWRNDPKNHNIESKINEMSEVDIEIREWFERSYDLYDGNNYALKSAFNKKFPDLRSNAGAISIIDSLLASKKPTLKGKVYDWKKELASWIDNNYDSNRDRMMMRFRNKFKHMRNLYSIETYYNDYLNSKEEQPMTEEFDDDRFFEAEEKAWEEVDDWLKFREGKDMIHFILGDEMDDEEKESYVVDDIIPSIHVMVDDLIDEYYGKDISSDITSEEVTEWFKKWCETNDVDITVETDAVDALNILYDEE